jgi:hypothetical protein
MVTKRFQISNDTKYTTGFDRMNVPFLSWPYKLFPWLPHWYYSSVFQPAFQVGYVTTKTFSKVLHLSQCYVRRYCNHFCFTRATLMYVIGFGEYATYYRGGQGSIPGQVMWDLWTKWHWGRFSPSTSFSPASSHSTYCSTFTNHPIIDAAQSRYWECHYTTNKKILCVELWRLSNA